MKLYWFRSTFMGDIPVDAMHEMIQYHARVYILYMIWCMLFPDASKSLLHAQWMPLLEDFYVCDTLS